MKFGQTTLARFAVVGVTLVVVAVVEFVLDDALVFDGPLVVW